MNGILIIDKPEAFTSFDVIAIVRGCMHERKTGHTGTLDPMATGVLPILLGSATKAQDIMPDTDKEYEAGFRLGITTDTLDITGKVLSSNNNAVSLEELEAVLPRFRGNIMQKPPMYSAVYKNGVRLYELARKGIEVEREERPAEVSLLELTHYDENERCGSLKICCSKGTYIRVICDDIGRALGCGCVMTSLRRTRACGYTLEDSVTLAKLRELAPIGKAEKLVRPVDSIFSGYGSIKISEKQTIRFKNGGTLMLSRLKSAENKADGEFVRVYGYDGEFIAIGIIDKKNQQLAVKKRF